MPIRILSSREAPSLYVGRAYWERRFREEGLWPRFLDLQEKSGAYSDEMDRRYPDFQFVAVNDKDEVVGVAHSVPVQAPPAAQQLPPGGWDWAVQNSMRSATRNALCGLSITVRASHQRRGLGREFIRTLFAASLDLELGRLIVPARPLLKQDIPNLPMEAYIDWTRPDGLHQDPWLRAHERLGGRIAGICARSMTISAPVVEWRRVTGAELETTGAHVVKGCLAPIEVDLEKQTATYVEPNVWIEY